MRRYLLGTVIGLFILTACGWNRSGTPADVGPQAFFRANLARTGVYESPAVQAPVAAVWEFSAEAWVDTAPAIVEGVVYFGSYYYNRVSDLFIF